MTCHVSISCRVHPYITTKPWVPEERAPRARVRRATMDAIKDRLGMSPAPPPPKPKGLGGFSLPWRGDDDAKGKSKAKAKPPLIGKFKGLQAGLLDKLKDQATAAITGGVSGVLVPRLR